MADIHTKRIPTTPHTNNPESSCGNKHYDQKWRQKKPKQNLINQDVQQGCPLSPVLFNLYNGIIGWQDSSLLQT
jgi:hypothetical protein